MRIRTRNSPKKIINPQESSSRVCSDLTFDTAKVVVRSDKSVFLQATLRNRGNTQVRLDLVGADDFRMYVFFISGEKLTRGAIPANNTTLSAMVHNKTPVALQPGETVTVTMDINIKNRTRFSPNFALQLIPPSNIIECDQTNNVLIVKE